MDNNTEFIGYASLIVSIVTAISAFFVFLKYDRKLKMQDKNLNDKLDIIYNSQIDRIIEDEKNRKKAKLTIEKRGYLHGKYELRIKNIGNNSAYNIRIGDNTLTEENGIIVNSLKQFEELDSNGIYDFYLMCCEGHMTDHNLTLIWDDASKKDNSLKYSIHL